MLWAWLQIFSQRGTKQPIKFIIFARDLVVLVQRLNPVRYVTA